MKNRPPNVIYPFPQHSSEEAPVIPRGLAVLQTQMHEKLYCRTSFQRTSKEGRQDSQTYISVMKSSKHTMFTTQEVHPVMQL